LQHRDGINTVAFSRDGGMILTGSRDRTAQLWEAATVQPIGPPLLHRSEVVAVCFGPNDETILAGSKDGTVRSWKVPTSVAGETERIVLWVQVLTGMELDKEGDIHVLDSSDWNQRCRSLEEKGGPLPQ